MYNNDNITELLHKYPFIRDFFMDNNMNTALNYNGSLSQWLTTLNTKELEDLGVTPEALETSFNTYITAMAEFLGLDNELNSLTIVAGKNKSGEAENFAELHIYPSDMIAIVGPTGSGKSRLLADIEWAASGDTPTGRKILVNNAPMSREARFDSKRKLVAQLSQNMNFVMDLTVDEFLEMHAQSRLVNNISEVKEKILNEANKLAGEKFNITTPITALSGGQSRALMIADVAILSSSPIVLIDEIENAGIDRKKALDLLIGRDKIVLIATHDPFLALSCNKRIVINNGGIHKIIETTDKERQALKELEKMDSIIMNTREAIRMGKSISL